MPDTHTHTRSTPHKLSEVAQRFMTRRCRNTLAAPSSFHMRVLERSAQSPRHECYRDHVFGLNAASLVMTSECVHTFPAPSGKAGTLQVFALRCAVRLYSALPCLA